jgi:hypothetical protein
VNPAELDHDWFASLLSLLTGDVEALPRKVSSTSPSCFSDIVSQSDLMHLEVSYLLTAFISALEVQLSSLSSLNFACR